MRKAIVIRIWNPGSQDRSDLKISQRGLNGLPVPTERSGLVLLPIVNRSETKGWKLYEDADNRHRSGAPQAKHLCCWPTSRHRYQVHFYRRAQSIWETNTEEREHVPAVHLLAFPRTAR